MCLMLGWTRAKKLKLDPDNVVMLLVGPDSALEGGTSPVLDGIALPSKAPRVQLGEELLDSRLLQDTP